MLHQNPDVDQNTKLWSDYKPTVGIISVEVNSGVVRMHM